MRTATLAVTAIVLFTVAPAPAAHISFESTEYSLPPNATDFSINVMATGGETVRGIDLFLGVQAGGPKIAGLDLTGAGLLFAGGDPPVIINDPTDPDRLKYATTSSAGDKTASGKLAIITLSTVGVSPGKYTFSLSVGTNASYFTGSTGQQIATTLGGTVLNVVPEPAAWIQLLGLIGVVPAVLFCRRKFGK